MAEFRDLRHLLNLLERAVEIGLDVSSVKKKISDCIASQQSETIKIALLGSINDGKTSTIAGMLRKVESDMKIDSDESSDEILVYHADAFGKKYEIVDTPGLFGTKEKDVGGNSVRYSEITERYISETHVVIYVCDAGVLKDSHKDIIRKVMRDYNKLESTIFVINRMDEVVNIEKEDRFESMAKIKREAFIKRLNQIISLTPDEEKQLTVVCISANPNNIGLDNWLKKESEYVKLSRISQVEEGVQKVLQNTEETNLRTTTDLAMCKDVVSSLLIDISIARKVAKQYHSQIDHLIEKKENELTILHGDAIRNRNSLKTSIKSLRESLFQQLDCVVDGDTFTKFIQKNLGKVEENEIDTYIFADNMKVLYDECASDNEAKAKRFCLSLEKEINVINEHSNDLLVKVSKGVKCLKVNNKIVLRIRNFVCPAVKFKPWGAIKFANKANIAIAVVGIAFEGFFYWRRIQARKKIEETKKKIRKSFDDYFKGELSQLDKDEYYFKQFAPWYLELKDELESLKKQVEIQRDNLNNLADFQSNIQKWYGEDIEDAVFEEI